MDQSQGRKTMTTDITSRTMEELAYELLCFYCKEEDATKLVFINGEDEHCCKQCYTELYEGD